MIRRSPRIITNQDAVDSDMDGSRNMGANNSGYNSTSTTGTKPSLMNKLNPMKDADGDGKKGVME